MDSLYYICSENKGADQLGMSGIHTDIYTHRHTQLLNIGNEIRKSKAKEELHKKLTIKCSKNKAQLQTELKNVKSYLKSMKQYRDVLTNRLHGISISGNH